MERGERKEHDGGRSLGDVVLEELYSFTGKGWEQEDDITLGEGGGFVTRFAGQMASYRV